MKLLCSESDQHICQDIANRLQSEGIDAEMRLRNPTLFDAPDTGTTKDLHEIWILNDEDLDRATHILFPDPETQ
jgi:hypothetical protein